MSNAATKRTRILTNAEWLGAEIERVRREESQQRS
jgi:hypothetical protein